MQDTRAAAAGGGHWPTGKGRGAVSSATVQLCWRMETGGLAESSSGGTAAWRRRRLGGRRRGHGRWAGIGFSSVSIAAARLAKEGKGIDKGTRRDVRCQLRFPLGIVQGHNYQVDWRRGAHIPGVGGSAARGGRG